MVQALNLIQQLSIQQDIRNNPTRRPMKPILILICILSILAISNAQYNKQLSYNLNRLSAITHCTQEQIMSWNCKMCNQGEKLLSIVYIYTQITNVMGYAGYLPSTNQIILSMRGTVDVKNWISNLSYKLINYSRCPGCLIHEGFYIDYLSASQKIISSVKSLIQKYPDAKIVVTGSSLGGALATIAALEIQLQTGKVAQLHAFGCPRVGNQNYAQFVTTKIPTIYRVTHNRDLVPHVPLQTQKFHHPATQILFDQTMTTYRVCNNSGQDPECSNSFYPNFSIPDHTSYWFKPVEQDQCTP